jgi:hypothetical protein
MGYAEPIPLLWTSSADAPGWVFVASRKASMRGARVGMETRPYGVNGTVWNRSLRGRFMNRPYTPVLLFAIR